MINSPAYPHVHPEVCVHIPAALRGMVNGERVMQVAAGNVRELLAQLTSGHPSLAQALMEPNGLPRRFVKIYVNEEDVQLARGLDTPLASFDHVFIMSAACGD